MTVNQGACTLQHCAPFSPPSPFGPCMVPAHWTPKHHSHDGSAAAVLGWDGGGMTTKDGDRMPYIYMDDDGRIDRSTN